MLVCNAEIAGVKPLPLCLNDHSFKQVRNLSEFVSIFVQTAQIAP
jgi:hypothetical protein